MRMLQIVSDYPPAPGYGVARTVEELSRALVAAGHEVHVLAASGSAREEEQEGVHLHGPVEEFPIGGYNEHLQGVLAVLPTGERLAELRESAGPFDVVAAHDWAGALVGQLAQRVFRCPFVATLHGTQVGRSGGKLTREELYVADMERWLCARADRIAVPSGSLRRELEETYSVPREKIVLVPDGVGAATFAAEVDAEEFRGMFAAPGEGLVLFAGRLAPAKAPDVLLAAVPTILKERPRTRFVVAGDGILGGALEERIAQAGLDDHVRMVGHVGPSVLGALYRVSDLLVIPSRYEAAGISALEAVLHDLPVVACDVGGLSELARTFAQIDPVPPDDPTGLARGICRRLAAGLPKKRDPRPADRRIPASFAWDAVARAMLGVFQSVPAPAGA